MQPGTFKRVNRRTGWVNTRMRVLKVHKICRQADGEDVVAVNERVLLVDHGHEARLWSISSDAIKGMWRKLQTARQAPIPLVPMHG